MIDPLLTGVEAREVCSLPAMGGKCVLEPLTWSCLWTISRFSRLWTI